MSRYRIEKLTADHLRSIDIQAAQRGERAIMERLSDECVAAIGENVTGFALTGEDGRVWVCYGLEPQHPGVVRGWSLIAEGIPRSAMLLMTRLSIKEVAYQLKKNHRIEMIVDTMFVQGHRWARMLGFEWEGTMRQWSPDRRDMDLYAIVRTL